MCAFTSEVFYEGRLASEPTLARQALVGVAPADGTGLRWLPVEHDGDATESIDEGALIAGLVRELLEAEARWTDRKGASHAIMLDDVVIVAPYNAHVERVAKALADAGYPGARVGTVDKFQGARAARDGVPVLAQPAQRGDIAGEMRRPRRGLTRAGACRVPQPAPDAARECALPPGRACGKRGRRDRRATTAFERPEGCAGAGAGRRPAQLARRILLNGGQTS